MNTPSLSSKQRLLCAATIIAALGGVFLIQELKGLNKRFKEERNKVNLIQAEQKFNVKAKLDLEGPDSTGVINVYRGKKNLQSILAKEGEYYPINVKLNTSYLLKFSKTGFTTKIVSLDTKVPQGREKDEFALFKIEIGLKLKKDPKEKEPTTPIGAIAYSQTVGDFNVVQK